jgi:hypothetical protein
MICSKAGPITGTHNWSVVRPPWIKASVIRWNASPRSWTQRSALKETREIELLAMPDCQNVVDLEVNVWPIGGKLSGNGDDAR